MSTTGNELNVITRLFPELLICVHFTTEVLMKNTNLIISIKALAWEHAANFVCYCAGVSLIGLTISTAIYLLYIWRTIHAVLKFLQNSCN